ncbi:COP9 signalosome complex subunit 3-like [Clytia hemisphaerica]|uniref:COP9 signalosome complex subunit 3 n=1 Tax=Clytia hemisphaerica TaxID=252671 RepID=A0A7M5VB73_9CNID
MEDFVTAVKVFCQDQNWKGLGDYINESVPLITKNASKIDSAISALDAKDHTLGYLGLIVIKLSLPNIGDFELFFNQVAQLIEGGCQTQIQSQGVDKFTHICHCLVKILVEQRKAFRGIYLIDQAIQKIQESPSQLTSLHPDFLQLCLVAKCMKPAIKYLNIDIASIQESAKDAKIFLLYYYYGGMVYLALKQYEKALFFFQVAVTTPCMVISQIMLEAYKKFLLLSIFIHGKIVALPKYTSSVVSRYLKPLSNAYWELADAYSKHDADGVTAIANKHQQTFQNDNNVGIVKQVISSLTKKRIQKLTKTFLTLSLVDMASRVKLRNADEAEKYLLEMIEDGSIYATIDQQAGMVSFQNNPDRFNSNNVLEKIHSEMEKCIRMNEQLITMDNDMQQNQQYVHKMMSMTHLDDTNRVEEIMMD